MGEVARCGLAIVLAWGALSGCADARRYGGSSHAGQNDLSGDAGTLFEDADADASNPDGFEPDGCVRATFYLDADHDGFGDPLYPVFRCVRPEGYVTNFSDCSDAASSQNPDAPELCDNVRDDDCDGMTDEVCSGQ